MIVKGDPLICAFGSRYLKSHKEKHLKTVVSNKMRELGRLLIAIKDTNKSCQSLLDCLKPELFDLIIHGAKIISGYDAVTDKFGAPSLILKIGASLKQCCDIAQYLILKKSTLLRFSEDINEKIADIKTLNKLIQKQWSYELSTNASKELYQKKWNKPSFLPLTSDIKTFRDHLLIVQDNALRSLKKNPTDIISFKKLQNSVLAQLILLNRKRAGEVERISLTTYLNCDSEKPQEEIELSLSAVEIQLTKIFKRLVVRGKRGRGVPILFTPKIQSSLLVLISVRETFCSKTNEYLFAIPNTKNSCLRASEVMRKLAIASGAKNPSALTSTKLRKQIATVAQLLSFNEGDVEQLANFMGHSKDIHKTFYRLPENVFQVAKVSKFLLMMEKGEADQYRGKNLDEINVNVNGLVSEESEEDGSDIGESEWKNEEEDKDLMLEKPSEPVEQNKLKNQNQSKNTTQSQSSKKQKLQYLKKIKNVTAQQEEKNFYPRKKFNRLPWTNEQKDITTRYFQKHILLKIPPKKGECENFIKQNQTTMTGNYFQFNSNCILINFKNSIFNDLINYLCCIIFRKKLAKSQNVCV